MPLYPFQHPSSGETIEVFFHMNDDNKKYIDEEGTEWKRVFSGKDGTGRFNSTQYIEGTRDDSSVLYRFLDDFTPAGFVADSSLRDCIRAFAFVWASFILG